MGPVAFKNGLMAFGSLEKILGASEAEWRKVQGLARLERRELEERKLLDAADREIEKALKQEVEIITFFDESYPELLKEIYDPPILLFAKGKLPSSQKLNIAIVGSRLASLYGLKMAESIAYDLALSAMVIVSGLAKGIDAAAHRGALAAKGLTIAVLGSGLSRIYPSDNKKMAAQIGQTGALLSEYPMDAAPRRENFPMRNRIISGLSRAVLVAEAREKSGALITADLALDEGREVYALPGHVDSVKSRGSNWLLKQGARFVTGSVDILRDFHLTPGEPKPAGKKNILVTEEESQLLQCLEGESPLHMDEIVSKSQMAPVKTMVLLSGLALKGAVRELPGKYFIRK
jgi:DNA processing protein